MSLRVPITQQAVAPWYTKCGIDIIGMRKGYCGNPGIALELYHLVAQGLQLRVAHLPGYKYPYASTIDWFDWNYIDISPPDFGVSLDRMENVSVGTPPIFMSQMGILLNPRFIHSPVNLWSSLKPSV